NRRWPHRGVPPDDARPLAQTSSGRPAVRLESRGCPPCRRFVGGRQNNPEGDPRGIIPCGISFSISAGPGVAGNCTLPTTATRLSVTEADTCMPHAAENVIYARVSRRIRVVAGAVTHGRRRWG